ncbi:MAG: PEP/pyruvate-binding domain-containing protein [Planctomycetota bacterium]
MHDPDETLRKIRAAVERFPALADRIERAILIVLHKRRIATVDEVHDRARIQAGGAPAEEEPDDNVAASARLGVSERRAVTEITFDLAARHLTPGKIADIVNLQRKREEARTIEEIANLSTVSFRLLAEKVRRFARLPVGRKRLPESEAMAVRVALIRHFISDQLEFIGVARNFLTIRDFDELLERILGDEHGMGRIGGKAAGLMLAKCVLRRAAEEDPDAPKFEVHTPESWYLRSDVIERFLEHEGLEELHSHKYKDPAQIAEEYPMILKVFKNGDFPPDIRLQLEAVVREAREVPLIVRSSSLLEDRFGAAFAGKYRSIFVANQGTVDERLDALIGAIVEVYASTLSPDAIRYRGRLNLLDYSENMAILIQKVVGRHYGKYFLPTWAGVAFSRNEYRRNPRVKPEDGLARLVLGLGTRAVDRVASEFPRMVPLGAPTLRAETNDMDIVRNSQHLVDVVNLEKNRFETVEVGDLISDEWMDGLDEVVSALEHGVLRRPAGAFLSMEPQDLVVTFDRWTGDTTRPAEMRWILTTLEKAYGHPVDIEYACDGRRFHLLQCRPQVVRARNEPVEIPDGIRPERKLFTASRDVSSAKVDRIEYVVCVDAAAYDRLADIEAKRRVARAVGALNRRLADHRFILMGPGRWGSKDPGLGVQTGFADFDNTRMLIEVARPLGGYVPEASFGSHFFQDLIESEIEYLSLYPNDDEELFDEEFFRGTPGGLARLAPEFAELEDVVRVVHVPTEREGWLLRVVMDGESGRALGYLRPV